MREHSSSSSLSGEQEQEQRQRERKCETQGQFEWCIVKWNLVCLVIHLQIHAHPTFSWFSLSHSHVPFTATAACVSSSPCVVFFVYSDIDEAAEKRRRLQDKKVTWTSLIYYRSFVKVRVKLNSTLEFGSQSWRLRRRHWQLVNSLAMVPPRVSERVQCEYFTSHWRTHYRDV